MAPNRLGEATGAGLAEASHSGQSPREDARDSPAPIPELGLPAAGAGLSEAGGSPVAGGLPYPAGDSAYRLRPYTPSEKSATAPDFS
jgi:hypothetical protein